MIHKQHKQIRKVLTSLSGFTIVELVVVITILAILGTISFVSFFGFQKSARDSKRVSNVAIIAGGLDLTIAAGKPINTTGTSTGANFVIVGSGLTMTGYYGPINNRLMDSLKVFGDGIVGYDGFQQYAYSYFPIGNMYQVIATLEAAPGAQAYLSPSIAVDTAYAATQTGGYIYIKGNFVQTGGVVSITPDPSVWDTRTPDPTLGIRTFSGSEMVLNGGTVGIATPPAPVVNGTCDPISNGKDLSMTPIALCTAGTSTVVVDGGVGSTYTWSCLQNGGGTNASCTANHVLASCVFDSTQLDSCKL